MEPARLRPFCLGHPLLDSHGRSSKTWTATAVFWGNQGDVYADATSGADGQSLYWLRSPTAVAQDRIDNHSIGPLFCAFGAVATLPMLWFVYRVIAWAIRSQWRRAGNRTAVFLVLLFVFFVLPWIVVQVNRTELLEDGERLTFENSQWLLIPAAFLTSWLLILWDLCWIAAVAVQRRFQREPTVRAAQWPDEKGDRHHKR